MEQKKTIKCIKDILSLEIDFNKTSIKEVREFTLIKCYELFRKWKVSCQQRRSEMKRTII